MSALFRNSILKSKKHKTVLTVLAILVFGIVVAASIFFVGQPQTVTANHDPNHCPFADGQFGGEPRSQESCEVTTGCVWRPLGNNTGVCQNEPTGSAGSGQIGNTENIGTGASCNFWCDIRRGVATAMLTFSSWLLGISAWYFDRILQLSVIEMAEFVGDIGAIDVAWQVLRDIINMAFIFILIYISIATILRIEEYGVRKLLARLVIIALLINFSLFFTKVAIDASNVLASEFIQGIEQIGVVRNEDPSVGGGGQTVQIFTPDGIAGAFAQPLQFTTLYGNAGETGTDNLVNDDNILTIGLAGSIFLLIAAFIFLAGAVLLSIRFIVLVFLMVTSPIAFAGMILPATKTYAKEWWDQLAKYVIFAPVYMALLLVVAVIVNDPGFTGRLTSGGQGFRDLVNPTVGNATGPGAIDVILNFVIVSGLMIMALVVAQKMGIRGAQGLSDLGKHIGVGAPKWLGGRALRYAGGRWNELTSKIIKSIDDEDQTRKGKLKAAGKKLAFMALNPVQFGKQWETKAQERLKMRQTVAGGAAAEVVSWITTLGKEKVDDKTLARRKLVGERVAELREQMGPDIDKADARDYVKRVANMGGLEGEIAREAFLKLVHQQGFGDDITEVTSLLSDDDQKRWADKLGLKTGPDASPEETQIYSDVMSQLHNWAFLGLDTDVFRKLRTGEWDKDTEDYQKWLRKGDVQEKLKVLSDLTPLAKGVGHFEQMYSAVRDERLGGYRAIVDVMDRVDGEGNVVQKGKKERTEMILGEANKIPIRDFMRQITWHNFMAKTFNEETGEWEPGGLVDEGGNLIISDYQRSIIENMGDEHYSQATHMQPRSIKYSVGRWIADEVDGELVFKGETEEERAHNERQFRKLEELNAGFAHAMKNVLLYGKVQPRREDFEERRERRNISSGRAQPGRGEEQQRPPVEPGPGGTGI